MPRRFWKSSSIVVACVLLVCLTAISLYLLHRQPQQTDCSFIGWKQSIGVELEAFIKDISAVKGQLAISDTQIRELDTLLKDYGAKYETACLDFRGARINFAEYSCRRQNMDRALGNIRSLQLALQSLSQINDSGTQRQVALTALQNFQKLAKTEYTVNCSSSLSVTPKKLTFEDHFPERSIQISNGGNNDSTFTLEDMPEAFLPVPNSGILPRGSTVVVAIHRIPIAVSNNSALGFEVRDNWNNQVRVEISVSVENVALYRQLASTTLTAAARQHRLPSLADALKMADSLPWQMDIKNESDLQASQYLVAAGILDQSGNAKAASFAFDQAIGLSPDINKAPTGQIFRGVLAHETGDTEAGLTHCLAAYTLAAQMDERARLDSEMCRAAMLLANGDTKGARDILKSDEINAFAFTRTGRDFTNWLGSTVRVPLQDVFAELSPPGFGAGGAGSGTGNSLPESSESYDETGFVISFLALIVGSVTVIAVLLYTRRLPQEISAALRRTEAVTGHFPSDVADIRLTLRTMNRKYELYINLHILAFIGLLAGFIFVLGTSVNAIKAILMAASLLIMTLVLMTQLSRLWKEKAAFDLIMNFATQLNVDQLKPILETVLRERQQQSTSRHNRDTA